MTLSGTTDRGRSLEQSSERFVQELDIALGGCQPKVICWWQFDNWKDLVRESHPSYLKFMLDTASCVMPVEVAQFVAQVWLEKRGY